MTSDELEHRCRLNQEITFLWAKGFSPGWPSKRINAIKG